MVAPKTLQTAATALFGLLVLPLVVVIAMIVGLLAGMGSAEACEPAAASPKAFSWPTETQQIKTGFSEAQGETPAHHGVDFEVPRGKKVFAARDGKVYDTSGDWVKIRIDDKTEIWYQFFDSKSVREGQDVKRGDVIGTTGGGTETSGMSGDHLHFEWRVRRDDGDTLTAIDPSSQFGDPNQPAGGGCGCSVGPDNLIGANNPQKAFNYLIQAGYKPHQAAGVVGNMQVESTSNVDPTAQFPSKTGISPEQALANNSQIENWPNGNPPRGRGNAWGIVQWFPASKIIDELRQAGRKDEEIASLPVQLDFLRRQLINETGAKEKEAGDLLRATTTVEEATRVFGMEYERFTDNPNDSSFAVRIGNAQEIIRLYGPSAPAVGGGTTAPGGCGAGNGDIVKTARHLAWDTAGHGHNPKPITPSYAQVVAEHNKEAGTHTDYLTDCGLFVATVMRMTGADPDYPPRGTGEQMAYLQRSPKYASQTSGTPPPGSILITSNSRNGHTYIYTGPFAGGYNSVSASLFGHVPEASRLYWSDTADGIHRQYTAFYLKNPPAGQPPATANAS